MRLFSVGYHLLLRCSYLFIGDWTVSVWLFFIFFIAVRGLAVFVCCAICVVKYSCFLDCCIWDVNLYSGCSGSCAFYLSCDACNARCFLIGSMSVSS